MRIIGEENHFSRRSNQKDQHVEVDVYVDDEKDGSDVLIGVYYYDIGFSGLKVEIQEEH